MGKKRNVGVIVFVVIFLGIPFVYAHTIVQNTLLVTNLTSTSATCLFLEATKMNATITIPDLCFIPSGNVENINQPVQITAYAPSVALKLGKETYFIEERRDLSSTLFQANIAPNISFGSETELNVILQGNNSFFSGKVRIYLYSYRQEVYIQGLIIDDPEQRISTLESWQSEMAKWREDTDTVLSSIIERLEEVKQWLFFWDFERQNICSAVESCSSHACAKDEDCGMDTYFGNPFCSGNQVLQNYRTYTCSTNGTNQCSYEDTQTIMEQCGQNEICSEGYCIAS